MNDRGQALIFFVLLLPLLLLMLALSIDIGLNIYAKSKLDDLNENAIRYVLEYGSHKDVIDKVTNMIKQNDPNTQITISLNDGVTITILKAPTKIFGSSLMGDRNLISIYTGIKDNQEITIKRMK